LDYLIENEYYEKEFLDKYTYKEIKEVFRIAYAKKFRFPSFMSAFKFYNDYALKTNDKKKILERYEDRLSIVALYLADGDFEKAKKMVKMLIEQEYQPATPTMLNAGRKRRGELVSCFLLEVNDSLNDISKAIDMSMQLSKVGGGVSLNLSKIRAKGEAIKGIENATKGVVGVMKLLDHAFRYADQMGQRQGSGSVYLNVFHRDINDFLETKKINADEDVRVKTLSIGVVIPDKMIELAREDKDMFVFYPHTVFKEYGIHLDDMDISLMYDQLVDNPNVRKEKINPRALLEKLAVLRYESGYPYIMFKDNVNKVHPNNGLGTVKFSNLCSEILEYSEVSSYADYGKEDSIGFDISCNLGSLNIANVMKNKSIRDSVKLAMDALTTVVEKTNIYNAPAVQKANEKMRSVGLGAMNLHGYLAKNKIQYQSPLGREFANTFFMMVNFYSLERSMELARDTGIKYFGYEKSDYASGKYFDKYLENDYVPTSERIRKLFEGMHIPTKDDWIALKQQVMENGLTHSYRLAIAPNGSISYVQSATASVMPIMEKIEERTYGNSKSYYPMPFLANDNWFFYTEAYEMNMFDVVDMIATIQQHVDQGISFTLFLKDTMTTRDLTKIDLYAHHKGIKTLYYARTKDTSQDNCLSCVV
jgi:ribonucleoside-diphosphate reductase alpha chain